MSDLKRCQWCCLPQEPSKGRFCQGQWVCYVCFPDNIKTLEKAMKCKVCHHKSNQGMLDANKYFICSTCNPFYHSPKSNKKKRKSWELEEDIVESKSKRDKKKKNKERKQQEAEAEERKQADERRRTRWVVVITDISTGDL